MTILSIETSCDETALSLLRQDSENSFTLLGNALLSQIEIHREFGGVYPSLAKREHAKNLTPLLEQILREAKMYFTGANVLSKEKIGELKILLEREPELFSKLVILLSEIEKPDIDAIAVTHGPGLEPALWVGINFAKALSIIWNVPVIPVNHMEGHIFSSILAQSDTTFEIPEINFPAAALLISGGHTEIVLATSFGKYEVIGETRDDAVGEAFDKVARMMGLPYPGGPEISKLADEARSNDLETIEVLPRPMINSDDLDFSFSGLKTAVLHRVKDKDLTAEDKKKMAREFEDAATDVLVEKTKKALEQTNAKTLIVGGGVSANKTIRERLQKLIQEDFSEVTFFAPESALTTDNAIMIAIAGFFHSKESKNLDDIIAEGHLRLA